MVSDIDIKCWEKTLGGFGLTVLSLKIKWLQEISVSSLKNKSMPSLPRTQFFTSGERHLDVGEVTQN